MELEKILNINCRKISQIWGTVQKVSKYICLLVLTSLKNRWCRCPGDSGLNICGELNTVAEVTFAALLILLQVHVD